MSVGIRADASETVLEHNGSDALFFDANGLKPESLPANQFGGDYIKLSDVKASSTAGGTFTSGAWRTRDLNTEDHDTGNHCSLAANQFTLPAGTYRIRAACPAYSVDQNRAKLYNITDAIDVILGTSVHSFATGFDDNVSVITGEFTIASSKIFELQHNCITTQAGNGFGVASGIGAELYTVIELWKVK